MERKQNKFWPEVEAALMTHESVMEYALIGIPDEQR
jgi:acyl-coenzyme A synthetase/AMP-(fatty) acid ligase